MHVNLIQMGEKMNKTKKKVAIIGHFGGNKAFFDGQTVKTKVLYQELQKKDYSVYKVDTYYKKKNLIKLLWQTTVCLFFHKHIFVLLSIEGMKIYFPLLHFISKIKNIKIYHDVIGGNLEDIIRKHPKFVKYLNSFRVNWVETNGIKQSVEKLGVRNVSVLPNFKDLDAVVLEDVSSYELSDNGYDFCTFSRVIRQKGITDAINSIAEINAKRGKIIARLNIYGPVEDDYKDEFNELTAKYDDFVSYRGVVESQNSVQALKWYYALLFPTRWHGEGFPGTILDCYASAIPVIASDWSANKEIVVHGKTGIIYPCDEIKTLTEAIEWAIDNKDKMDAMKIACRNEYEKYTPEHVMAVINQKLME